MPPRTKKTISTEVTRTSSRIRDQSKSQAKPETEAVTQGPSTKSNLSKPKSKSVSKKVATSKSDAVKPAKKKVRLSDVSEVKVIEYDETKYDDEHDALDQTFNQEEDEDEEEDQLDDNEDDEGEEDENEEVNNSPSLFSSASISALLSEVGPNVTLVILKQDGEVVESEQNMSPSQATLHKLLDGTPTLLGSYESIDVVVASLSDSHKRKDLKENKHSLPAPLDKIIKAEKVKGDIVLLKMDKNSQPQNFSIQLWENFKSNKSDNQNSKSASSKKRKNK